MKRRKVIASSFATSGILLAGCLGERGHKVGVTDPDGTRGDDQGIQTDSPCDDPDTAGVAIYNDTDEERTVFSKIEDSEGNKQFLNTYRLGRSSSSDSFTTASYSASVGDSYMLTVELDTGDMESYYWTVDDCSRLDVIIVAEGVAFSDLPPEG